MTPRLGGLTISIVLLLGFSSFVLAQYEEVKPKRSEEHTSELQSH